MSFYVDGQQWDYPCTITRTAEMTASEISGLLLDKSYFNDVLGTYLRYSVTVAFPIIRERTADNTRADYYALYHQLTDPVDAHQVTMPYNDSTLALTARVEKVQDVYVRLPHGHEYWEGISFELISVAPTRSYDYGEAVARGLTPLPSEGGAEVGDLYLLTSDGWVLVYYQDADVKRY